ncbi:hypothetical protein Aph01nite_12700 [Acrocarpospora phusangensis]|uniref:Uncharacterized protein n=1 Tax=Acrocarpospora phusangensis TaxID=1070424 RepID=A0A919QA70_9ACTN|nr:hypothetical protein [Acrocarpospora phusangensis]GIH22960.1 hypothetical protein Aph01nite_12700 [Acrocarpospora phusangensis]
MRTVLRTYQEIRAKANEVARETILRELPEDARPGFLADYEAVGDAAPERLPEFLHTWWMRTRQS